MQQIIKGDKKDTFPAIVIDAFLSSLGRRLGWYTLFQAEYIDVDSSVVLGRYFIMFL